MTVVIKLHGMCAVMNKEKKCDEKHSGRNGPHCCLLPALNLLAFIFSGQKCFDSVWPVLVVDGVWDPRRHAAMLLLRSGMQ